MVHNNNWTLFCIRDVLIVYGFEIITYNSIQFNLVINITIIRSNGTQFQHINT